jgi:hypothetical protein
MAIDMNKRDYFAVADRRDISAAERLTGCRRLALDYFQAEAFEAFCEEHMGVLDEVAAEYFGGPDFDSLLVQTVRETFPPHEHGHFVDHFRGLVRSGQGVRPAGTDAPITQGLSAAGSRAGGRGRTG